MEVINVAKKVKKMVAAVAFMVIVTASLGVASASASTTPESGYSHSKVTSVAFKVVKQKGWIGVQEHIRIQKVPKSQCEWFDTFYNSNYLLGQTNHKPQMYIDHHGYLCRDKFSPTGWVKRGGGHTGSDCGNIAAPPSVKPMPVRKPPVLEVNSASEITVKVKIKVKAAASIALPCGTATGSGFAYDLIEVKYSTYIKSKHSQSLRLKLAAKVIAKAKDRAEATAEVKCGASPPPPCHCEEEKEHPCECVQPKHWVDISCTGFEEISGGGSFLVDCVVSDDNGAPISLQAHSNDGNSRVSGINCWSNSGSQTCPSGGIFEFRVSGINDGSSIVYSSITATASANGVSKAFTSDPFPVDPEDGGF